MKRCGGQGDILSGAVGTMLAWGKVLLKMEHLGRLTQIGLSRNSCSLRH